MPRSYCAQSPGPSAAHRDARSHVRECSSATGYRLRAAFALQACQSQSHVFSFSSAALRCSSSIFCAAGCSVLQRMHTGLHCVHLVLYLGRPLLRNNPVSSVASSTSRCSRTSLLHLGSAGAPRSASALNKPSSSSSSSSRPAVSGHSTHTLSRATAGQGIPRLPPVGARRLTPVWGCYIRSQKTTQKQTFSPNLSPLTFLPFVFLAIFSGKFGS